MFKDFQREAPKIFPGDAARGQLLRCQLGGRQAPPTHAVAAVQLPSGVPWTTWGYAAGCLDQRGIPGVGSLVKLNAPGAPW